MKVELEYVPNTDYISGTKLSTAFASGQGPDIFLISPGDFLRYYNGGVLLDLTPYIEDAANDGFPRERDRQPHGRRQDLRAADGSRADGLLLLRRGLRGGRAQPRTTFPRPGISCSKSRKKLTTPNASACSSKRRRATTRTSPGIPSCGRAAATSRPKDGKSAFDSPATVAALKLWQDAVNTGVAPRQVLGGGVRHRRQSRRRAIAPCRTSASGASRRWRTTPKTFHTASSSCRRRTTANMSQSAAVGRSSPTPRARTPRTRQSSAPGRWLPWTRSSVQRVADWCTVAKIDMPPRKAPWRQSADDFSKGKMGIFSKEIYPGTRAEPRLPPEVYKNLRCDPA